jgi:hypothetical protein
LIARQPKWVTRIRNYWMVGYPYLTDYGRFARHPPTISGNSMTSSLPTSDCWSQFR